MSYTLQPQELESFYKASLIGLKVLDLVNVGQQRFGADADARWAQFAGHLTQASRVDILLRDAAVTWKSAFAGASVFGLPGLAEDEPFGPDWPAPSAERAKRWWQSTASLTLMSPIDALDHALHTWGVDAFTDEVPTSEITPATRILVGGMTALQQLGRLFAQREDLSWSDQVLVLAPTPKVRHLAGLLGVFVQAREATRMISSAKQLNNKSVSPLQLIEKPGFSGIDQFLLSKDAHADAQHFAQRLQASLGRTEQR